MTTSPTPPPTPPVGPTNGSSFWMSYATPGPEAEGQLPMPVEVRTPTGDAVIRLGELALQFGRVNRVTFHPDGTTPESDTDHTVMLSLVACSLAQIVNSTGRGPLLDLGVVAQLAPVHDLPEVYAGDTNTMRVLTDEQKADKKTREKAGADRITNEFGATMPWVVQTLQVYEEQRLPEARFVRAVDKLLPKVTHLLNQCRTLIAEGISEADVRERYRLQVGELREYASEWPIIAELHTDLVGRVLDLYAGLDLAQCEACRITLGPADRRHESTVDPGVFCCHACFVEGGGADAVADGTHSTLS